MTPRKTIEVQDFQWDCVDLDGFNVRLHVQASIELELCNRWFVKDTNLIKVTTDNFCDYPRTYSGDCLESDLAVEVGLANINNMKLNLECQEADLQNGEEQVSEAEYTMEEN